MTPQRKAVRPLPARSLIASLLLRSDPPRMRGARLVQWCALFGVSEGTARVALSRMVDRGELRGEDGVYELAGRVGGRRVAQDWSLEPDLGAWNGEWRMAVVAGGGRSAVERSALRYTMRHLRFAEWREGVWLRPDNVPESSAPVEWWRVARAQCAFWIAEPDDDPHRLANTLFAPAKWSARAAVLRKQLVTVTRKLDETTDTGLAAAFATGARAIAHIRSDPLLPDELADAEAGRRLRAQYRAYELAFSKSLQAWFRRH
jgi:phenylacetic acid degradation operon negative regulatory protein